MTTTEPSWLPVARSWRTRRAQQSEREDAGRADPDVWAALDDEATALLDVAIGTVEELLGTIADYRALVARLTAGKRAPSNGTDTSDAAADRVKPRMAGQRLRVMRGLDDGPATDEWLADRLGLSMNTVRPRRGECVDAGWVRDSGRRFQTLSGSPAIMWELTPAGVDALLDAGVT